MEYQYEWHWRVSDEIAAKYGNAGSYFDLKGFVSERLLAFLLNH